VQSVALTAAAAALVACENMGADKGKGGATSTGTAAGSGVGSAADPGTAVVVAETGPILIGHYASMTGSEATFGLSTDQGVRLALDERNKAGGIKGRTIEVLTEDTASKNSEAGTVVQRLIHSKKVVAVLGEVASSASLAGGRVAQQYGVPMISPSSTNERVTEIGDMIFRVCFVDGFQGYVVAKFTRDDLKLDKVAILLDQSQAYSKGLAESFTRSFKELGGTIVTEQAYTGGDPDFSAQLQSIKDSGAQAVFVPGYYTDAGNIARQARKLGIKAPLLGGDGWDSVKLTEIGGAAIEGSYYSNHYSHEDKRPEVVEFVSRYKARFGVEPDGLAALGYDAARVMFDAMDRAPSMSGKDLAAAIAATTNFAGVTGTISIDAKRNAQKQAVMLKIAGGKPTYVTSIAPSTTAAGAAPATPATAAAPAVPAAASAAPAGK
jgi:branched-chain amino acid transport system substrate-binding protein